MSLALYRSHRPKDLDELVGQDHIRPTLDALLTKTAVADRPPAHAILLTGPRGVGKTSVARIIARRINGLKASADGQWLDIIEIDGASHNRVDQIRDLIDKSRITPSQLKYKVYIIDEVHTLAASQVSFQAFLKTLEEPPEHVVFILATTEVDKVPATIVSRCQRFAFRAIDAVSLAETINRVAAKEKIKIDPEAAALVARHSRGSLRDGLSILDQLGSLGKPITAEIVRQSLGLPQTEQIDQLYLATSGGDLVASINQFRQLLVESGASVLAIADGLIDRIRQTITTDPELEANLTWLDGLVAVRTASQPEAQFEVALIRRVTATNPSPVGIEPQPPAPKAPKATKDQPVDTAPKSQKPVETKPVETKPPKPDPAVTEPKPSSTQPLTIDSWRTLVAGLPLTLQTTLSKSQPTVAALGELTLSFAKAFDANKFDDQSDGLKRQQKLLEAITTAGFDCPKIKIVKSRTETTRAKPPVKASVENTLSQINDIFGS